ncbi:hypothetical protein M0R45_024489 [Rubus argutus]|uniref:Uncharacterized protein n=1 Tax=Rubus argutus TaxID=59490 RepID=A0AAW1WUG6_RUBAR
MYGRPQNEPETRESGNGSDLKQDFGNEGFQCSRFFSGGFGWVHSSGFILVSWEGVGSVEVQEKLVLVWEKSSFLRKLNHGPSSNGGVVLTI